MPKKGTKRVKAHTRKKYLAKGKYVQIEDPFSKPTKVKEYYRGKPKKKKPKKSNKLFGW